MSALGSRISIGLSRILGALLLAALLVSPFLGEAAAATPLVRPNIVLILTDDQTMASVAHMPYVSSRTDWISFDRAHINNSLCCPSRATILRGQYDTHTGVTNNAQSDNIDEQETLAVWLRRAGYQTGLFGKYLNGYPFPRGPYVPPGWTWWQAAYHGGSQWTLYDQYHWKMSNNGLSQSFLTGPSNYMVDVLANRMISWIRQRATAGQPFFAMYTPTATHSPWRASPSRIGTEATTPVTLPPNFNIAADDQPAYLKTRSVAQSTSITERRKEFEGAASIDDAIRRIDTAIRNAGVLDRTVVIFMTDNGYSFGSHRWRPKRCEYNECTRTPMLVRYPGLPARHDTEHLVSNVDIASTVAALAGATPGVAQDGMSFAPLILGEPVSTWRNGLLLHWSGGDMEGRPGMPDSMPQYWAVLGRAADGGWWKYVELDTGERELYDEGADPYEMNNLYGELARAGVQTEMQAMLGQLKADADAPTGPGALRADMPVPGPLGPDLG
jgi:N-acetylglucosamine-6-sulfatase